MSATPNPSHNWDAQSASIMEQLLFDGLSDRPIWARFLTELSRQFGGGDAFIVMEGAQPSADMTAIVAPDPAVAERISGSIDWAKLRTLPTGVTVAADVGFGGACALRVHLSASRSSWLVVQTSAAAQPGAIRLLDRLSGTLARVLPLYELLGETERKRRIAEYVIETSGTGTLLVEADGTIVTTNTVADELIARGSVLTSSNGRLRAGTPAMTQQIGAAIAEMARLQSSTVDPLVYASFALADPERLHPLTLIVRPGPPYGPVSAPLKRTALLILRDPARPAMLPVGDLERLFGLSPAEARLATRLADGDGLDEAAQLLGISRNTARSQLQSVFAKTGVNRQGDLVRLLLSSVASHAGSGRLPD